MREILFSVREFIGGIARKTEARKLRTVRDSLRYQLIGRCRRSGGKRLICELIAHRLVRTHGPAQFGQSLLRRVLRTKQQKLIRPVAA